MADKNPEFHEGVTAPVGEESSYGWTPEGTSPAPVDGGSESSYGWAGSNGDA